MRRTEVRQCSWKWDVEIRQALLSDISQLVWPAEKQFEQRKARRF